MLIEFNVKNVSSIHTKQTFSMVASTSNKEDLLHNLITIDKYGIINLLKSSVIFGANGSGKSNLCWCIERFKQIVLQSIQSLEFNVFDLVIPFILQDSSSSEVSELEVSFIHNDTFYRYGIAFLGKKITEEWLFRNNNIRETELFHREAQTLTYYNQSSFKEADDFVEKKLDVFHLLKTKENVPFITTLAQFNGEVSSEVIDWFKNVNIISGIQDTPLTPYTAKKIQSDSKFKRWALDFLANFQITDVSVETTEEPLQVGNRQLGIKRELTDIQFFKKIDDNQIISMPFELESDGIKKVFNSLGPLYDTLYNNRVLIFDEFDSKFHTLLSKYLIQSFNLGNQGNSQLIITAHDTNLLSKEIFRRDQIWFIEKNEQHESELFSLLEYKAYYSKQADVYRKDYLAGKFGAIPLFADLTQLNEVLNG